MKPDTPRRIGNVFDLRPCDSCHGPVGLQFYVVRYSLALVKAQAVHEVMGMHQYFGGRASRALIENFSGAADGVVVAMDKEPGLMTELAICSTCYMGKQLDLPMLSEQAAERQEQEKANA